MCRFFVYRYTPIQHRYTPLQHQYMYHVTRADVYCSWYCRYCASLCTQAACVASLILLTCLLTCHLLQGPRASPPPRHPSQAPAGRLAEGPVAPDTVPPCAFAPSSRSWPADIGHCNASRCKLRRLLRRSRHASGAASELRREISLHVIHMIHKTYCESLMYRSCIAHVYHLCDVIHIALYVLLMYYCMYRYASGDT